MATNDKGQNTISKYVWVVETILRHKKITFKELSELWLRDEISGGVELPKRTFDNWRYAIWDMFGINIENERKGGYHYYIENEEDISGNGISSWLYNTLSVSASLSGCKSIKDRILLEYIPSGQKYLQEIIGALKENRLLTITYQSYWSDEESCFDVEPYCIKLFRQRWYLVARSTHPYYQDKGPRIYALDRIGDLQKMDETFRMPKGWNAEDYFEGFFGIITDRETDRQLVKLKVSASQACYLRDLKLHISQEEKERNENYSIFTYYLRPTFDFQQEILWNNEEVEVLEPQWLREEIAGKIERMWRKYNE